MTIAQAFTLIGSVLGMLAFLWRLTDEAVSHLECKVAVLSEKDIPSVRGVEITVENKTGLFKRIHYSALLVGPVGETLRQSLLHLPRFRQGAGPQDPLAILGSGVVADDEYGPDGLAAILPLPALYRESSLLSRVALSIGQTIDLTKLEVNRIYQVTLVLVIRYPMGILRFRRTSALLSVPGPQN
jgi:hypothetical protein